MQISLSTRLLVNLFRIQCPHGVENSDNRDADIGKDCHPHRGYSEGGKDKHEYLHGNGKHHILHGDASGASCNGYGGCNLGWLVVHEHHVGSLYCSVRAQCSHGYSYIGKGKHGGIIDAVANEDRFLFVGFRF